MQPLSSSSAAQLPNVEHLFQVLKHDWVWQFFFESDQHRAEMFSLAVEDKFSMLFDLAIRTEDSSDPYVNSFAVRERHRALVLPTFSNGPITLGFGVCDRVTSSSTLSCRQRYFGKVARDDSQGVVYFISTDVALNLIEVTTYSMFSPTARQHVFSIFRLDQFMDAIQCIRDGCFRNQQVAASLVYFYEAFETRPCSVCNTSDSALCKCPLSFSAKKHPRDIVTEIQNMTAYMGTFRGAATLTLCSNGAPVFSSTYNSSSFLNFYQDPHIKRELIDWALKYVLQRNEVNPLKLVMAEAADMKSRFVTATDTFLLASIAESILSKPIHFEQPPPSPRECLPLSMPMADTSMETLMNSMEPSTGMGAGFGTAITHINALSQDPEVQQLLSDQKSLNSNKLLSDSSESMSFETLLQTTTTPWNVEALSADDGRESSVSSQSGNESGSCSKRKLAVLAPAPAVQSSLSGAEKTKNQIDEDRRKRIELRKARNRESAQRSNLRKKLQLQHLKDELEAEAAKEACLRAREKTLREENMRLRTAIMR